MTVVLDKKSLKDGEIDAIEYLKRKGEHMLAVRVASWRNGMMLKTAFIGELSSLVYGNGDNLIEGNDEKPTTSRNF